MRVKLNVQVNKGVKYLNIPFELTYDNVGQEDLVNTEFVNKEVDAAINPINDYEKVRLEPTQGGLGMKRIDYKINLLKNGVMGSSTMLSDLGLTNDDVKFKRNVFTKSFLNLLFFDNDIPTTQTLIGRTTMFNRLSRFDLRNAVDSEEVVEAVTETSGETELYVPGTDIVMDTIDFSGLLSGFSGSTTSNNDLIVGEIDDSIGDNLLVGRNCSYYVITQLTEYYVDGLKYKIKTKSVDWGNTCADFPPIREGNLVSGQEASMVGIPGGLFDKVYLVNDNYTHNFKSYKLYVKWTSNFFTNTDYVSGVYFVKNFSDDGNVVGDTPPNQSFVSGAAKDVSEIPLRFIVENPIKRPRGFAEGYYLYHQQNDIPNSIYMRATYNNAKTGVSSDLVTSKEPKTVEEIISKLHIKYDLKYDGNTYYYEIDTTYSDNIVVSGDTLSINLYEIQVK
jgi:hypothetical protein